MKIGNKVICIEDNINLLDIRFSIYNSNIYKIIRIFDNYIIIRDKLDIYRGLHKMEFFITLEEFREKRLVKILNK